MNINYKLRSNNARALTLVEMIGVMAVIAVLFTLSLSPLLTMIQRARIRAEQETVARIRDEIKASFRQDDMTKNISAIPGDIPLGVDPTVFDNYTFGGGVDYDKNAWYARLAQGRGQHLTGMSATESLASQAKGEIQAISYNIYNRRRLLIKGPDDTDAARSYSANPDGHQRYLLLSFMFPDGDTNAPVLNAMVADDSDDDKLTWFNNLYDFAWGSSPDHPTGQPANWSETTGGRGLTYGQRVVAERIVQPRYTITVNNLSVAVAGADPAAPPAVPAEAVYVYANMDGNKRASSTLYQRYAPGGNASFMFPLDTRDYGVLEGRRILIRRGDAEQNDAVVGSSYRDVLSVLMNENMTYTAQ